MPHSHRPGLTRRRRGQKSLALTTVLCPNLFVSARDRAAAYAEMSGLIMADDWLGVPSTLPVPALLLLAPRSLARAFRPQLPQGRCEECRRSGTRTEPTSP
jgi:hypothetical protein